MPIDPDALTTTISDLRHDHLEQGELEASLRRVVEATCGIFGVAGAGLMLVDDSESLHYVAATDDRSAALEAAQAETGQGPCVESLLNDVVVHTSDVVADDRWPELGAAVAGLGIAAVLGVPIHAGRSAVGSLNVYTDHPREWDAQEVAALEGFAQVLEELVAHALLARQRHVLAEQLDRALRNRVTIERAVGVVMARQGLGPVAAFDVLRRQARSERRKVADVAAALLEDVQRGADRPRPTTTGS